MVASARLELARPCGQQILGLPRLPNYATGPGSENRRLSVRGEVGQCRVEQTELLVPTRELDTRGRNRCNPAFDERLLQTGCSHWAYAG